MDSVLFVAHYDFKTNKWTYGYANTVLNQITGLEFTKVE